MNRITKVEITLHPDGYYRATATKRFSEEHGGGESTIPIAGPCDTLAQAMHITTRALMATAQRREAFELSGVPDAV